MFKLELGQNVNIKVSGEQGQVTGRADYIDGTEPNYRVHYKDGNGCAKTDWFSESLLE